MYVPRRVQLSYSFGKSSRARRTLAARVLLALVAILLILLKMRQPEIACTKELLSSVVVLAVPLNAEMLLALGSALPRRWSQPGSIVGVVDDSITVGDVGSGVVKAVAWL